MHRKTLNRLAILRRHLDKWASQSRHNRQLVAELVVEKFNELHMADHIPGTGVEFSATDDLSHDMRTHAQKLWRWLGAYEEAKPGPDKLWYIEQAVVAAMPRVLRIAYLLEVYADAGVTVAIDVDAGQTMLAVESVIQEDADATKALVALLDGVDPFELDTAERELMESIGASQAALSHVRSLKRGEQ